MLVVVRFVINYYNVLLLYYHFYCVNNRSLKCYKLLRMNKGMWNIMRCDPWWLDWNYGNEFVWIWE